MCDLASAGSSKTEESKKEKWLDFFNSNPEFLKWENMNLRDRIKDLEQVIALNHRLWGPYEDE